MAQEDVSKINIFANVGNPKPSVAVSKVNIFAIVNRSPPPPPPPPYTYQQSTFSVGHKNS